MELVERVLIVVMIVSAVTSNDPGIVPSTRSIAMTLFLLLAVIYLFLP